MGYAKIFHEFDSVIMSAVSSSESGHSDSDNPFSVKTETIKRLDCHKKSQSAVKSARYTDNSLSASYCIKTP